jgi:hypothetical protein
LVEKYRRRIDAIRAITEDIYGPATLCQRQADGNSRVRLNSL